MKRRCGRPAPGSPAGAAARERIEAAIDAAQGDLTRTRLAAYCDADPKARERLLATVAELERKVDALWARITPSPAARAESARPPECRQDPPPRRPLDIARAAPAAARGGILRILVGHAWADGARRRDLYAVARTGAASACRNCARSVGLCTLPVALRGSAATKAIVRGHLKRARLARQCAAISASPRLCPG